MSAVLPLAALLAALLSTCGPQDFQPYAVAVGSVRVEGVDPPEPVDGAVVVLAGMQTTTEDEGNFRLDEIPLGDLEAFITVSKDGFRTFDDTVNFQSSGGLTIELARVADELQAGTINGRLRDGATEEPLGEVEVRCHLESGGIVVDEQKAHTSNEGEFQISGIPVGDAIVTADLDGYIPAREEVFVLPGQGSNRFLDIAMTPGNQRVVLEGYVFDVETLAPLADVLIGADESTTTAVSGADGTFSLADVLVGQRTINAAKDGYDPLFYTVLVLAENEPLELGMAAATGDPPGPAYSIAGTITAEGQGPAPGADVVLIDDESGTVVDRTTADENGGYGFLAPGGGYVVKATLPGYATASVAVSIVPGETRDNVDLVLGR